MARVMIVEDDPAIQHSYEFVLTKAGHEVLIARDGAEACKLVEKLPQVIFLDMLMPGLSGLDFLREIDIKEHYPDMIVVGLSNIDSPKIKADALKLGATEYHTKVELNPSDLVKIVDHYTKK